MTVKANTLVASASFGWTLSESNSPFASDEQGPDKLTASYAPNTTTYNYVQAANTSIGAGNSTTVNLNSFTDLQNRSRTATKALGLLVKATAASAGGQLQISPGDTNPATWWFPSNANTETLTLNVGTSGCAVMIMDGSTLTVSNTTCNLKIANPGNTAITVTYGIIEGA